MAATTPSAPSSTLTLSQAFAQKIKELLEERGLSQVELAKALNISQPTVSYLLKPHSRRQRRLHPLDFYQRLVQSLGLELSGVLSEVEARVRAAQGPNRRPRLGTMRLGEHLKTGKLQGDETTYLDVFEQQHQELSAQLQQLEASLELIEQRGHLLRQFLVGTRAQLVDPEALPEKRKRGGRASSPSAGNPA
jgi:transcriptional regulator with XRE-family HTH domain